MENYGNTTTVSYTHLEADWDNMLKNFGSGNIVVSAAGGNTRYEGKSIREIGESLGVDLSLIHISAPGAITPRISAQGKSRAACGQTIPITWNAIFTMRKISTAGRC